MDGNMLEAFREKEIAEMMMTSSNYSVARDKLLKAKDLFPSLDNITGMLTVCDILCAANVGISGYSTDWYWILQLKPGADESTIESQFCKLINLLEPIKNEFPGTVSALKLIKKAFHVLSDRERREEFDKKRLGDCRAYGSDLREQPDMEVVKRKTEAISQSSAGLMRIGGDTFDVINELSCSIKNHKMKTSKDVTEKGVQNAVIYTGEQALNDFSIFDEPRKKIRAQEAGWISSCMGTGSNRGLGGRPLNSMKSTVGSQRNPSRSLCKMPNSDYYNFNNNRKAEAFSVGQVWAAYDQEKMPRRYYRICGFTMLPFQLRFTCLKPIPGCADEERWCTAGLPVACGAFKLDMDSMMMGGASKFSHVVSQVATVTDQPVEIYPRKGEVWAIYIDWKPFDWCADPKTRKGYRLQMVEIVTSFSQEAGVRVVCLEKVNGFRNIFQRRPDNGSKSYFQIPGAHSYTFSHMVPAFRFAGGEMNGISAGMFELDPLAGPAELVQGMAKSLGEESSSDYSSSTDCPSIPTAIIMSKPEVEEDLKSQWTAKDFVSDQIWAIYDGPDFLPRQYVRIKNLISSSKVCVTLLKPYPIHDDEVQWVKENLPFVCGLFRADRITCDLHLSRFSHLVKCERSKDKSFYRVYPKKGDIWAVYRNWNSKWTRSNYNGRCCRIVEVLSDFSEESGLRVASLVEVTGFLTFFRRQLDDGYELLRTVSRREMLSFSHQIPAFIVAGIETHGLPQGSLHLEPDALPSALSN
ncbi:uncharacterized protein LOC122665183 [Telopea speciosissima]|uniref:uncharacterized protein LOC122665183 n=1 Tax=Telopea speciosissima TaxID=54955 RepID=UPI001CC70F3F|nr:uncharacterized protein LOC122665183 [Telopea speciosissima]XP_043717200.1 uncharacterized protein LOC122665183 [Telopea speciosissima]